VGFTEDFRLVSRVAQVGLRPRLAPWWATFSVDIETPSPVALGQIASGSLGFTRVPDGSLGARGLAVMVGALVRRALSRHAGRPEALC
jgi:hypothetical protein